MKDTNIIPNYTLELIRQSIEMVEGEIYPKDMIERVPSLLRKVLRTLERINSKEYKEELFVEFKNKRLADTDYLIKEGSFDISEFLFEIINASTEDYRKLKIRELLDLIER